MIAFSIGSNVAEAQQQLLKPIATEELPDDFNFEEVYRLDAMFEALNVEVVQIYSPHLLTEGEVLLYGGSEIYYNSDTLVPISVEAQSIFSFEWRGLSNDNSLDVTIVRDSIGFSGTVIDRVSNNILRIISIDEVYSLLLKIPKQAATCGIADEHIFFDDEESTEDCEQECVDHIDILFIINPDARDWLGPYPDRIFNIAVSDLERTMANSLIGHSLSYQYVYDDYGSNLGDLTNNCIADVRRVNDSYLLDLVSDYNSDIAFLLVEPSLYEGSSADACAGSLANPSQPIVVIPPDLLLSDYLFVHEAGHLFGGAHESGRPLFPDCAKAKYISSLNLRTAVSCCNADAPRVDYFSDPNIDIGGVAIGESFRNNAGVIRGNGCLLASFNPTANANPFISLNGDDCLLNLTVDVSIDESSLSYVWYWNTTGFFINPPASSILGNGSSLSVQPPQVGPCSNFFIHVKVYQGLDEIASRTIQHSGDICNPLELCEIHELQPLIIDPEKQLIDKEQVGHYICNYLGVTISLGASYGSGYSALNLPEGIYYEIQCFSDGSIVSHPFVITN